MEKNIITEKYDSAGHFLASLERPRRSRFHRSSEENEFRTGWTGTASINDALKLASNGWVEGTQIAKRYSERLAANLQSTATQTIWQHQEEPDGQIDIARFIEGEPEHWFAPIEQTVKGRFIEIVFNCTVSCGVETQVIIAKGAAIAALVEALEIEGYRVQVKGVFSVACDDHRTQCIFTIKHYNDTVDLDALTYWLAHPSSLRRLGFRWIECQPRKYTDALTDSYGRVVELEGEPKGDLYIGRSLLGEPQWTNADATVNWIKKQTKILAKEAKG